MKVIETEIEWLKVAGMGVYSLSRGVVVAEVVRPWGLTPCEEKTTVVIYCGNQV